MREKRNKGRRRIRIKKRKKKWKKTQKKGIRKMSERRQNEK